MRKERIVMRKLMIIIFVALLAIPACSQQPKTEEQKAFYALGVHLNKQLSVFDLSPEELKYVQQGISDAAAGKKLEAEPEANMSLIHISEPTRLGMISYAVFCLKKKK